MKKITLVCIFCIAVLTACKDKGTTTTTNEKYMSIGKIIGGDPRECMCCGGWFILIDSVRYRFYQLPDSTNFKIDTCKTFPVYIDVDWTTPEKPCMSDLITVTKARKRN